MACAINPFMPEPDDWLGWAFAYHDVHAIAHTQCLHCQDATLGANACTGNEAGRGQ